MRKPIHVLCSNFTEIVSRKLGKTLHCFADKNSSQNAVFRRGAILRPFSRGRQKFAGACHVILSLPAKFRPNRFRFAGVIPEKVILYKYSICRRYNYNDSVQQTCCLSNATHSIILDLRSSSTIDASDGQRAISKLLCQWRVVVHHLTWHQHERCLASPSESSPFEADQTFFCCRLVSS